MHRCIAILGPPISVLYRDLSITIRIKYRDSCIAISDPYHDATSGASRYVNAAVTTHVSQYEYPYPPAARRSI